MISILDSEDQVTIINWFVSSNNQIDFIQPVGSSEIAADEIESMLTINCRGNGNGSEHGDGSGYGNGNGNGNGVGHGNCSDNGNVGGKGTP